MSSDSRNNVEAGKEHWYSVMAARVPLPAQNGNSGNNDDEGPMLFVGSLSAAESLQFIRDCEITHILTVAAGLDVNVPKAASEDDGDPVPVAEHLVVECHDHPMADILGALPRCLAFVHRGLRSGRVLVHCASGVSRSVAVCAAYAMMAGGAGAADAIASVASARKYANPNLGFRRQLSVLERHILADEGAGIDRLEEIRDGGGESRSDAIIRSAREEYSRLQSDVVQDTIRQRTVVNILHAKVDALEEKLATMKSRLAGNDGGSNDHGSGSDIPDGEGGDVGGSNEDDRSKDAVGREQNDIEKALLLLQEELDTCLPTDSEGLVDPPARMIRRAAVSKVERLLGTLTHTK